MKKLVAAYLGLMAICAALVTGFPFSYFGGGAETEGTGTLSLAEGGAAAPAAQIPASTEGVTAAIMAELTRPLVPAVPVPDPAQVEAAAAALKVEDVTLQEKAVAVLDDLQAGGAPKVDDGMYDLTVAALNGLSGGKADNLPAKPQSGPTLEGLVADGLRNGATDAEIDLAVNEAAAAGEVAVPATLVTSEGKVDTAVLLAAVLQNAKGEGVGQGDASAPSAAGDEVSLRLDSEDVLYKVAVGDSLGSLALRYYGDADKSTALFEANRTVLATPNSVRVGQELILPARSKM